MASIFDLPNKPRVHAYSVITGNAKGNSRILEALSALKIDENEIDSLKDLIEKVRELDDRHGREQREQQQATEQLGEQWAKARWINNEHRDKAKILFKHDVPLLNELNLSGSQPKNLGEWVEEQLQFYRKLLADNALLAAMDSRGSSKSDLEYAREQIELLVKADEFQELQKAESESAGARKREALAELDDQMHDFMGFAEIALREDPQLMEALLKNVPSK
jgi:hypothetical protein